jgi:hypothetical protein
MDYFQRIVTESLRAARAALVNAECQFQHNPAIGAFKGDGAC